MQDDYEKTRKKTGQKERPQGGASLRGDRGTSGKPSEDRGSWQRARSAGGAEMAGSRNRQGPSLREIHDRALVLQGQAKPKPGGCAQNQVSRGPGPDGCRSRVPWAMEGALREVSSLEHPAPLRKLR